MDSQLQENVCLNLNSYLMNEFGCKTKPAKFGLSGSFAIDADRKYFRIYLRCLERDGFWPKKTLVIINFKFLKQRNGSGTRLVNFLIELSKSLGVKYIGIESTNKNSSAFAINRGFSKYNSENNYIYKIT